jgi:hypothetical protein
MNNLDPWLLKMRPLNGTETSDNNHLVTESNNPEEQSSLCYWNYSNTSIVVTNAVILLQDPEWNWGFHPGENLLPYEKRQMSVQCKACNLVDEHQTFRGTWRSHSLPRSLFLRTHDAHQWNYTALHPTRLQTWLFFFWRKTLLHEIRCFQSTPIYLRKLFI